MSFQYSPIQENRFFRLAKFLAASLLWKENRIQWCQYFSEIYSHLELVSIMKFGLPLSSIPFSDGLLPLSQKLASESDTFSGVSSQIIILSLICGYFIFVISIFSLMGYKFLKNAKISMLLYNFATYGAQFHHSIIFWNLNVLLLLALTSENYEQGASNIQIALFILNILLIILNYLFGALGAIFCYDPFLSSNAFASYNSNFQTLSFLQKAIISSISLFTDKLELIKWIILVMNLGFAFCKQELIFLHLPYYKLSTLKFVSAMASIEFVIAVTTIISNLLFGQDAANRNDIIFFELISIVLAAKVAIQRINMTLYKYASLSNEDIKTSRDVFKRIIATYNLHQNIKVLPDSESHQVCNQQLLFLMGEMSSHRNQCHHEVCICNYICKNKENKGEKSILFEVNKISSQSRINLVLAKLSKAIKFFQGNNKFKILMAYILLKNQGKFCAALLTLFSANRAQQTLEEKVLIFWLTQQLEQEIDKFFQQSEKVGQNKNTINMKRIVDFEKKSNQMFTLIRKNTQTYMHLWNSFLKPNIPLHEFYSYCVKAEKEADEVQEVWNGHFVKQKHLSLCICLYVTYLSIVRNLPSKAEKIISRYHTQQKNQENMIGRIKLDGSGDVIFYISVARERLCRILHVSRSVCKEFGWSQPDLINQNIKMIHPPFIKKIHDQIVINHIEKPKNQPDQSILNSFVRTKEGFCVPVHIHVTIFPYIHNEPIYAGMVQKKYISKEFLVIAPNGNIEAFSKEIGKDFGISFDKKVNISEICPDFARIGTGQDLSKRDLIFGSERFKESNKKLTLTFLEKTVNNTRVNKKVIYKARIENHFMLDQHYVCLYLSEKRISHKENSLLTNFKTNMIHPLNGSLTKKLESQVQDCKSSEFSTLLYTGQTLERTKCQFTKLVQPKLNEVSDSERVMTISDTEKPKKIEILNEESESDPGSLIINNRPKNELYKNHEEHLVKQNILTINSKERTKINESLEQAVYVITKEKYMKVLDYLIFVFAALCSGFMAFHVIDSYSEFTSMLQKVQVIIAWHRITFTLVNVNGNIRLMDLITRDYISLEESLGVETFNWTHSLQSSLLSDLGTLSHYHSQILETLSVLDKPAKKAIYGDKIPIKGRDSTIGDHSVNSLEVITELISAINNIAHLDLANVTIRQSDVEFVLNNTLNNPFSVIQRVLESIIIDCKENLYLIQTKTLVLLPLVICSGACILVLLLIDTQLYVNKRNQFIEILLKMDQSMLQDHLRVVNRINHSLQNDVFHSKLYYETKMDLQRFAISTKAKTTRTQNFAKITKNLNKSIIKGVIFTIIAILTFSSAFLVLCLKFNLSFVTFLRKIDQLTHTYELHTDLDLYNVALLEYISENNSTKVKNKPIKIALDELSESSSSFPNYLERILVDDINKAHRSFLKIVILQDLCQVVPVSDISCRNITEKAGVKDFITMATFLISSYQESKRSYDNSNHTLKAAFAALNTKDKMLSYELTPLFTEGMQLLKDVLREDLQQSIVTYREQVILITIIYTCVYLITGLLLSHKVWRDMKAERVNWRKIIRHIPFSVVSSNKSLKAFLIRNCNDVLYPFRNML